jgi:N-methylhydantoinase B
MKPKNEPQSPIELAIFQSSIHSIAEEMGAALRRTAISPNIKERRDYSCALFDAHQRVIAMGDHMPVHLGAMPMSVKAVVDAMEMEEGDVAILNDPYAGGTHLPDITLVLPIFVQGSVKAAFYVAARAHHADVGGMYAGSMGPAQEIYQEGIRIPPIRLMRRGEMCGDVLALLLANVRTPAERQGDLSAQIGACRVGERRLHEVIAKYGLDRVNALVEELLAYSERLMRAELRKMPAGVFHAEDFLDGDGVTDDPIRIAVAMRFDPSIGSIEIDFQGSSPQVRGSVNAVFPITYSACFYMLRCLLGDEAPATAGLMNSVAVLAPEGSVVNARLPAPVAAGNVETSQRITDTLLRALAQAAPDRVPAASYGTMSNLTVGGVDHRTGLPFTYYETTAGGMGARICVSFSRAFLWLSTGLWGAGHVSGRPWIGPRDRGADARAGDAALRSSKIAALWFERRRERRAGRGAARSAQRRELGAARQVHPVYGSQRCHSYRDAWRRRVGTTTSD